MPEPARFLARFHFQVADRGAQPRVPIDQPLVAIQQPLAVELDEHLDHRGREVRIHREPLVGPVHRTAEPAELRGDLPAALGLPRPYFVDERLTAEVGALHALLRQVSLDHHLRRDARMVGADHPARVLALQPRVADQDVLQCVVERVADVERAGDVGRRVDDRPRFSAGALGAEQAVRFPMRVPARFDRGGVESLGQLAHARAP